MSHSPVAAARAAHEPAPWQDARELPASFIDWQIAERRQVFAALERGELPRSFAAHLPVVSTIGGGPFPVHSATKGAGLTPKDAELPQLIGAIEDCLALCAARPWPATLGRRIALARLLYDHPEHIDRRRLGLIEIFRGQTYHNILDDPRVTLLFTGPGPHYLSYQVNALATVVAADDPCFRFILGMRQLFERDRFHIQQPAYPTGYLLWVHAVIEKTPRFGRAGRHLTGNDKP